MVYKYSEYLCLQVFGIPWVVRVPQSTAPLLHQALQVFKHLRGQLWQTSKKFWHLICSFRLKVSCLYLFACTLGYIKTCISIAPPCQHGFRSPEARNRDRTYTTPGFSLAYISSYYSCVHTHTNIKAHPISGSDRLKLAPYIAAKRFL